MKMIFALSILMFSFGAHAQIVEYSTEMVRLDPEVRVESITRDGVDLEVVHLGNGEIVEIPVDMSLAKNLSYADARDAREDSRRLLEGFTHAISSSEFNGIMDIDENGQAEVVTTFARLNDDLRQGWARQLARIGMPAKGVAAGIELAAAVGAAEAVPAFSAGEDCDDG